MKVICDDKIPFLKGVLEKYATVEYYSGNKTTNKIVADADALITRTRTICNKSLLENSKVTFIGTATIGFDHIDTEWVEKNGIEWTNSPGCNSGSVKQYIAASLSLLVKEEKISLEGKTIGIIGVGNVGSKVAIVAESFGMNVLLNDPPRQRKEGGNFVSLENIIKEADFITFHVPLNHDGEDKTYHLLNNQLVDKMKPGVIVFNSSRGEITETQALLNGLKSGIIAKSIIDVWENEPQINIELMNKAFIATPHIAGYSLDGKANGTAMTVNALSKKFGLPLNQWFPDNLPVPAKPIYRLNCTGKTPEQALGEAILHTYPINEDVKRLKNNPETFEDQRGSYPMRREFGAYEIEIINSNDQIISKLKHIGFGKVTVIS